MSVRGYLYRGIHTFTCCFSLSGKAPALHADTVLHRSSTSGCSVRLCAYVRHVIQTAVKGMRTRLLRWLRQEGTLSAFFIAR